MASGWMLSFIIFAPFIVSMLLKIIALFSAFVNGFSDFVGSVFLGIFSIHLSQTIDWKIRLCYIIITKGQLTQLVEYLRHMEGVRGSSPLLPTIIRTSPRGLSGFFFCQEKSELRLLACPSRQCDMGGRITWRSRTRSLLRRCRSLRVPYCPPRRNATNFANKTAKAVLFALMSVSPFPKKF